MQMTGKNLQNAVVLVESASFSILNLPSIRVRTISLSTGSRLPKYGLSDATEQILEEFRTGRLHDTNTVLTLELGTKQASTECQMLHQ